MKRLINISVSFLTIATVLFSISGCEKRDIGNVEAGTQYSAILCVGSWPNTAYYISSISSLTSGTISLKGNGAEMTGKVYAQDVIQKDGYYYHANATSGRLGKYHVENGVLLIDKEIPFSWLNWSAYTWVDNNTLVIIGDGKGEARYAIVKVDKMTIKTGSLALDAIPEGFSTYNIGFAEYRDNKLFLGYGFGSTDWTQYPNMPVYPKSFVAVIDYTDMVVEKSLEDNRSNGFGGPTVYAPSSFIDENNDLYFISDPVGIYDYNSPSAMYRIKNGSTEIDPTYFFNYSAAANNEKAPAIWYIGNGKAIVRSRINGQSIDTDHYYTVIDVQNGALIKKLDLPADKGERMVNAVIVEDGKAYIAVNAADRDYIWEYDPASDKLTKGVEFVGGIDYILRIEKLK
ncbi:DUF4374 domain-containing protein [Pseudobacter ginsenosidimutans]|uniref:Uncharacterized protein DUF4374 n=1 Tax=Pseudobacter ginsenosidimutans TaxID=661488 RepID=A0A4Q7MPP5_9BACT|nr:DUF4374 domain-containing protein [Pseudobacter ginsenosidimutans]QEC42491.1 DUF4374 domain-containing protein [Pseudobacter ginsenosidimutans]RZS70656.1 uncharacterized protein DUF4374 [Pseudobacter ginsenosidimutans]